MICSALCGAASNGLKSDKLYRVCWNMSKKIDLHIKDSEAKSKVQKLKKVSVSVGNDPVLERRFQYERKIAHRRTKAEVQAENIRTKKTK